MINDEKLEEKLESHYDWLEGKPCGVQAVLTGIIECEDLSAINMSRVIFDGAEVVDCNLNWSSLCRAIVRVSRFHRCSFWEADLDRIDVEHSAFVSCDFTLADLSGAHFRKGVNLHESRFMEAELAGANLEGVRIMMGAIGDGKHIKSLQCGEYPVTYTADMMQIGCGLRPIREWLEMTPSQVEHIEEICPNWWAKWKPILAQIVEASPAEPTVISEK